MEIVQDLRNIGPVYNQERSLSQAIFLRGAKHLLTLRGTPNVRRGADSQELAIIQDGSVLIRDGKIVSIGPTRRLENMREARAALDVPVHGHVVMPGFVDPGIQLSLFEHAKKSPPPRRRKMSEFHEESVSLMRSCLQHGTLTAGIRAYTGLAATRPGLSMLRQLARIGDNPVAMVRIWGLGASGDGYPPRHAIADALNTIRKQKLASLVECRGDLEQRAAFPLFSARAADLDWGLNWTGGEDTAAHQIRRAVTPAAVFCEPVLSTDACNLLAHSACVAVFKAGHELLEQSPGGSARPLVDAGGAIALTSGYDAEDEMNFNMQWVVALGVMRLRLSVEQAIVAATINAAYALGVGDQVGTLEVNKRAEIMVLNVDDYRELPRRLGSNYVGMVIRNGVIAMNRTRWKVGAA